VLDIFYNDKQHESGSPLRQCFKNLETLQQTVFHLPTSLPGFSSLGNFYHLSRNSSIKFAETVFTNLPFRTIWPNWLIFFGHFTKFSVYAQK